MLGFSDEFCWNFVIGLLFAAHLAAVWRWTSARKSAGIPGRSSAAIRWLAGASFSIYLVHYPVMQFLDTVLPDALALRAFVLLALTLGACFLFAEAFERPLPQLRSALRQWFATFGPVAATPAAPSPARSTD